ncbi:polyprenyl synthetase family protein [Terasakiispira papahanaumokuakeensis]|uniref:polyprenyl synthetase family protein n=1 Tax=Terasakiispira papahanaumokuakeensis TaxID=197479 RepID=UPI000B02ED54|nr:polyprenyl synthetase family protein [Terasakiispira papahanaumokuakeensis]
MTSTSVHDVVKDDFLAVDRVIRDELSSNVPLVEKIGDYIISSGGKRLRPLLTLLAARSLGYSGERHHRLAALIEFMHTSTLLHDDVVDESTLRRGRPTANTQWSNASCVLVGDFLYSRSFEMMVKVGSMRIMEVLSHATCVIAEGEVMQLTNVRNPRVTETQYMDVIHGKTAMLFEAASHSGAILAEASPEAEEALREYGCQLGLAFQLIDDLLDYEGDAETMGKNVGDDLAEGKPTLPLIQAMAVGTEAQAKVIRQAIRQGGLDQLSEVMTIIQETQALSYTRNKAIACARQAQAQLHHLPSGPCRQALHDLAELAISRRT